MNSRPCKEDSIDSCLPRFYRSVSVSRDLLGHISNFSRNFPELLRVVDSLQLGDKYKVSVEPVWKPQNPFLDREEKKLIQIDYHPSKLEQGVCRMSPSRRVELMSQRRCYRPPFRPG